MNEYEQQVIERLRALHERDPLAEVYCLTCDTLQPVGNLTSGKVGDGSIFCRKCDGSHRSIFIVRGPAHRALILKRAESRRAALT